MRLLASTAILGLAGLAGSPCDAATIAGTVKGPDGAAFRAAFVQARNTVMKMTVSVLSDNDGRYVIESLPAGDYRLSTGPSATRPIRRTA